MWSILGYYSNSWEIESFGMNKVTTLILPNVGKSITYNANVELEIWTSFLLALICYNIARQWYQIHTWISIPHTMVTTLIITSRKSQVEWCYNLLNWTIYVFMDACVKIDMISNLCACLFGQQFTKYPSWYIICNLTHSCLLRYNF
jgi:hypothetical protein